MGKSAVDPISGTVMPPPIKFDSDEERDSIWRMQHFIGLRLPQSILGESRQEVFRNNKSRALKQVLFGSLILVSFLCASIASFDLLGNKDFSVIPVLCIVFFGISMSAVLFLSLRYQAATELERHNPEFETVKKLLKHKIALLPARASSKAQYLRKMLTVRRRSTIENGTSGRARAVV